MAKKRKYEKYVDEVIQGEALFPEKADKAVIAMHHDMGINELNPHFIDIGMNIEPHATEYGESMIFPDTSIRTRSFPHKHAVAETFAGMGLTRTTPMIWAGQLSIG